MNLRVNARLLLLNYHSKRGITKLCLLPSSFQPPPSSLQHPQQYLNQNIARNLAISTNLDRKIKSCPFWLKIGTNGIWNFDPKIHFWANLGRKSQSCSFFPENWHAWHLDNADSWCTEYLKDADTESRLKFLKFWSQNPFLGKFGPRSQSCLF